MICDQSSEKFLKHLRSLKEYGWFSMDAGGFRAWHGPDIHASWGLLVPPSIRICQAAGAEGEEFI